MVSDVFDAEDSVSRLELEAVEMEPVVSGKFIVIEVNSKSELIFVDELFALSAGASVWFGVLNFEVLPEVADVFFHESMSIEWYINRISL